jgi:hypothetical protein
MCTYAYIAYSAYVAVTCTSVYSGHIRHLYDEHSPDPQSPSVNRPDRVNISEKMSKIIFDIFLIQNIHFLSGWVHIF